ncbi:MAG: ABC transporter ATP-binding protein [Desulfosarcinaceae bacterium]|nr:ABC transporter ATP-binding protein [Desulfosarcinaceae bacterium]
MSYLVADRLTKTYGTADAEVVALNRVGFEIAAGEFVAVMGESGSGKSTLLSILGAMNAPSEGTLFVDDIDVYQLPIERQADFRREYLGFVFQHFHLVPYLTVLENVMLPLVTTRFRAARKHAMAQEALAWVGLADKVGRLPAEVSGGEKERVALARAIVNNPPVLLADEPTGSLDSRTSGEVMTLLQNLNQGGTTIVMVTHSEACATYAERVLRLADGRLVDADPGDAGGALHPGKPLQVVAGLSA